MEDPSIYLYPSLDPRPSLHSQKKKKTCLSFRFFCFFCECREGLGPRLPLSSHRFLVTKCSKLGQGRDEDLEDVYH